MKQSPLGRGEARRREEMRRADVQRSRDRRRELTQSHVQERTINYETLHMHHWVYEPKAEEAKESNGPVNGGENSFPIAQRCPGEEHPAEAIFPLRGHMANSMEFGHYLPTRPTGILLGLEDPLAHRLDHLLLFSHCSSTEQGFEEISRALFNDSPTPKQQIALDKLDEAVEKYLSMEHPIWEEIRENIVPITGIPNQDAIDKASVKDRAERFHREVALPILAPLRSLGVPERLLKEVVPGPGPLVLYTGMDTAELREPRFFLESDRMHWRQQAVINFFHPWKAYPSLSKDPYGLYLPSPVDNTLRRRDHFTPEEIKSLSNLDHVLRGSGIYFEPLGDEHALAQYGKILTWGMLLDFAMLVQEYNLEWAMAAMDWDKNME